MIDKIVPTIAQALAGTPDGATVLIGGFGDVVSGLQDRRPSLIGDGDRAIL